MYWDHKKFFALFVSKLSHCSDCPCKSEAPHWIALYLLTLLHSFIWHMFLITGKTRPGLRRKIVVKQNLMKSLIKPRGGLIRWLVTCSSSSQISSHCSLDPVEMEATRSVYRLFAWYLMSIRNTQAGPQWPPWPSQPASQPGDNEKWDLGNWQQPRPPSERGRSGKLAVWSERRQEANKNNKNNIIFQSDEYSFLSVSRLLARLMMFIYYYYCCCCYLSIFVILPGGGWCEICWASHPSVWCDVRIIPVL